MILVSMKNIEIVLLKYPTTLSNTIIRRFNKTNYVNSFFRNELGN